MSNKQTFTGFRYTMSEFSQVEHSKIERPQWRQFFDTRDGLVHDCIETSTTADTHVMRCARTDPMRTPEFVEDPVTCMSCLSLRNSDGLDWSSEQMVGCSFVNAKAISKLQMRFVKDVTTEQRDRIAAMHQLINAVMPAKEEEPDE